MVRELLTHGRSHLGRHHHVVAVAACSEPLSHDLLGHAAGVCRPTHARRPGAVAIGRVDEVAAQLRVSVEYLERRSLVHRPAELHRPQADSIDEQAALADLDIGLGDGCAKAHDCSS